MKPRYLIPLLFVIFLLLGQQCNLEFSSDIPTSDPLGNESPTIAEWDEVESDIFRKKYIHNTEENRYVLTIYKFDPQKATMNLHHSSPPKRLDEWMQSTRSSFIINGGYFNENFNPTGYFAIEGEEINKTSYSLDKSGLLVIKSGTPSVVDTTTEEFPTIDSTISVLQSFPLIIKSGGEPGISEDSNKLARRTVVAQDDDGDFLVIIVDQTPLSLHKLMEVLIASDLNIDVALNLDGGPSTALHFESTSFSETLMPITALPQMISITSN